MLETDKTRPTNMSLTDADRERLDDIGKQMGIPYRSGVVRAMAKQYDEQLTQIALLSATLSRLESIVNLLVQIADSAPDEQKLDLLAHFAREYEKFQDQRKES